jgi:(1->4)-alpha-D-glucan 1-alpha-D-glucosylmutase
MGATDGPDRPAKRPEPIPGLPSRARIPRATYRLQLHAGFTFADAAEVVPYLHDLGISHCYFSPYFAARPGSEHGYDVIDHNRLNPELGSEADFEQLCAVLREHGMGQIMDLVPNHVGVMGRENQWWLDVLEHGPASAYADYFDIDWNPLKDELRGKVLVPVLGDHYGNCLDRGELRLLFDDGAFSLEYYEHCFPIDPREYPRVLEPEIAELEGRLGSADTALIEFQSLITALSKLPPRSSPTTELIEERRRDAGLHKRRLAQLCADYPQIDAFVGHCLHRINADPARLHDLLEHQAYRLAYWRVAADEINYRRFFDINDLAALSMERAEVFESTHGLVLELLAAGLVQGVRIDHPDGLYDPAGYFDRLQAAMSEIARGTPTYGEDLPVYLLVEKILSGDERLPLDWPVHGTTGYEFANLVTGLLVNPDAREELTRCYTAFIDERRTPGEIVYTARRLIALGVLDSELQVLASELARIAESDPHTRDYTRQGLLRALAEIVSCFPVYRSYITGRRTSDDDRAAIEHSVSCAKSRSRAADTTVFDFARDVLLTDAAKGRGDGYRRRVLRFAMRFQQYTAPVAAKGVEDTALYRYHRLIALNEVGGDIGRFGVPLEAFHRANRERRRDWPHAMLSTSTHDTKRSGDVRARLCALSELTGDWEREVNRWAVMNERFKTPVDGVPRPDRDTEYLLYQTLIGAWPLAAPDGPALDTFRERIRGYMLKAVREAKLRTSWINPDPDYEAALTSFVEALLDPERNGEFLAAFLPLQQRISRLGLYNGLSQTLLKLTVPGVPDIYQGDELWDFSLVDPDNRRPVDFDRRRRLLSSLREMAQSGADLGALLPGALEPGDEGRAKLLLTWRLLELRRRHPDLFIEGDYLALSVSGEQATRLCAFARHHGEQTLVVVAPRWLGGLSPIERPWGEADWGDTRIEVPAERWGDVLLGDEILARPATEGFAIDAAELMDRFPGAVLLSTAQP